jgi:hypothetical protein
MLITPERDYALTVFLPLLPKGGRGLWGRSLNHFEFFTRAKFEAAAAILACKFKNRLTGS